MRPDEKFSKTYRKPVFLTGKRVKISSKVRYFTQTSKKGVDKLKIFIGSIDAPRREIFKDTSQTGLPNRQEGQNRLQKFDIFLNLEKNTLKGTGQSCRFPSLLYLLFLQYLHMK